VAGVIVKMKTVYLFETRGSERQSIDDDADLNERRFVVAVTCPSCRADNTNVDAALSIGRRRQAALLASQYSHSVGPADGANDKLQCLAAAAAAVTGLWCGLQHKQQQQRDTSHRGWLIILLFRGASIRHRLGEGRRQWQRLLEVHKPHN